MIGLGVNNTARLMSNINKLQKIDTRTRDESKPIRNKIRSRYDKFIRLLSKIVGTSNISFKLVV